MKNLMIEDILLKRYPGSGRPQIVRDEIANACNAFVDSGLADVNFIKELSSESDQKFWSCVSETLLAAHLCKIGIDLKPSHRIGPDFLVIDNGKNIWIEVICPEPIGVPSDWLTPGFDNVINFPHEQMLLRWTSAIKEKAEKLIGSLDGATKGYIEKGIVASEDAYVIAVNGCQLRSRQFPALFGISQFPFAVEAVFAVGPYQITINSDTLERTGSGHQHRPFIPKSGRKSVPAYTFLDSKFQSISAIWAVDVNGSSAVGNAEPMVVIHNPKAISHIPIKFLPAYDEYIAKSIGNGEYELNRLEGRLA
jgi:hypothetical protein